MMLCGKNNQEEMPRFCCTFATQNRGCLNKMYDNYIFDLYGTLVDIRTNENKPYLWKKMSEIYTALGAAYSPVELKRTFRQLEKELTEALPKYGEPDLREVFAQLFQTKGVDLDSQMIKTLEITFRSLSRQKLCVYENVRETLAELKKRGKGVYLLSNAQSDFTRPELEILQLTSYFDGILISSEEGYKKPSAEFYQRLIDRFGLNVKSCLMVGNDEGSDIVGARNVGMDSLYIHTDISPDRPVEGLATYSVMDGDWKRVAEVLLG